MTDVTLQPGETAYVRAPAGETVTVWKPRGNAYAKVKASGTAPVPPIEPPPTTGTLVPVGQFNTAIAAATAGSTLTLATGTHANPSPAKLLVPATVQGQPGAVIAPANRDDGLWLFKSGSTVRGLAFRGSHPGDPDGNGSALMEVNGRPATENGYGPVADTLIEDCSFSLPVGDVRSQHGLYLAGTIERLTARRMSSNGNGGGAPGLHGYHPGATPGKDVLIEDWTFTNHDIAILIWLRMDNLIIRRCTFIGSRSADMRLITGGTVLVEDCRGSKGIWLEPDGTDGIRKSILTERNNDWTWLP